MKQLLFLVYNKPYGRTEGALLAPSASMCIRDNAQFLKRANAHFDEDLELREVGSIDENGVLTPCDMVVHSWDEYKNPEVQSVPLTPEQLRELNASQAMAPSKMDLV